MTKKILLAATILAVGVMVMGAVLVFGHPNEVEAAAGDSSGRCLVVRDCVTIVDFDGNISIRCWDTGSCPADQN